MCLVCLDAPIITLLWLWLFARTFALPVRLGNAVALFLTAWLIYLADRLTDAISLKSATPRSLRQEFCLRHREIWISALLLIGGFDVYVTWRSIAEGTFLAGAVVGILAVVYLALNYPRGLVWRALPAKEVAIGLLFTAGTLVALLPSAEPVTPAFIASGLWPSPASARLTASASRSGSAGLIRPRARSPSPRTIRVSPGT